MNEPLGKENHGKTERKDDLTKKDSGINTRVLYPGERESNVMNYPCSPTDKHMSPCSARILQAKQRSQSFSKPINKYFCS
jgi:Spo12 family